jgi:hypothetical protein
VNKRTSKEGISDIEGILWKQIDLEREKIKAYEAAYIQEKCLRRQAVTELRKYEERMFGELTDIPEGIKEGESILMVPKTPEKEGTKQDEDAPLQWREDEKGPPQPRTPEKTLQRRYDAGPARTIEDLQDRSPRPKRAKTPSQESDESSGGVGGEKERFTVPEIVKRYKQEKDQTFEGSSHSWSRPRINMIRFCP